MSGIKAGDWVCFLLLSQPTYAKVEYVLDDRIITTAGEARMGDILESRPQEPQ
jgi:hypothetical protein